MRAGRGRYFASLPANKLELWFALEAERFQACAVKILNFCNPDIKLCCPTLKFANECCHCCEKHVQGRLFLSL